MNQLGLELYGFSGKMGTGKNYIAEKLFKAMLPSKNTVILALADHFKVECCAKDGVAYHRVFGEKDGESRKLLQKRGTEEGRAVYGEDIWTKTLETWIRRHHETGVERVIITDLRFPNEVEWIKKLGGMTFRINALDRNKTRLYQEAERMGVEMGVGVESISLEDRVNKIANHSSEIALDGHDDMFDFLIDNDYCHQANVPNQVRDIIRKVIYRDPVPLTIFCDLDDTICHCRSYYRKVIDQVAELLRERTGINQVELEDLLNKHVYSFEKRYYSRDDFSNSLVKVAMEAFIIQDRVQEFGSRLIEEISSMGESVYNEPYDPLNPDSVERLREISKLGQVVIYTLGDHTEQMKKVVGLDLLDFSIEVFTHKDENMFRYLQNKYPSKKYVMIGDSYSRDICPAAAAGIDNLVQVDRDRVDDMEDRQDQFLKKRIFAIDKLNHHLISFIKSL
ncbi:MAG: HAD family hydrolase [Candidatus Paceibacterota bacterium]